MSLNLNKQKAIIILSVICLVMLWFLYASMGTRGTDQYWYWAAVKSIVEEQTYSCNTVFPSSYAKSINGNIPFVHNIPSVYLAAVFSYFLGYYWGWAVFNLLCILLSFYFSYKILTFYWADSWSKVIVFSLWMLFPLHVWTAFQPNAESFITLLITILTWYLLKPDPKSSPKLSAFAFSMAVLVIVLILLAVSRSNYLTFVFFFPLIWLNRYYAIKKVWLPLISCILLSILGVLILKHFMPTSNFMSPIDALYYYNSDPYYAGMLGFYQIVPSSIHWGWIFEFVPLKLVNALKTQFFRAEFSTLPYYLLFNIACLSLIMAGIKHRNSKYHQSIFYFTILIFGTQFLTAFFLQNQLRYIYPYFTSIFVIVSILWVNKSINLKLSYAIRYKNYAISIILLGYIGLHFILIRKNSIETASHKAIITAIQQSVSTKIPPNAGIWLARQNAMTSYALHPRLIYSADTLSDNFFNTQVIESLGIQYIIENDPIKKVNLPINMEKDSIFNFKDFTVFSIIDRRNSY